MDSSKLDCQKAKQARLIIQLLLHKDRHKSKCHGCCNSATVSSTYHILCACRLTTLERLSKWTYVLEKLPPSMDMAEDVIVVVVVFEADVAVVVVVVIVCLLLLCVCY